SSLRVLRAYVVAAEEVPGNIDWAHDAEQFSVSDKWPVRVPDRPLNEAGYRPALDLQRSPRPNGHASPGSQSPSRDLRDRPYPEDSDTELSAARARFELCGPSEGHDDLVRIKVVDTPIGEARQNMRNRREFAKTMMGAAMAAGARRAGAAVHQN